MRAHLDRAKRRRIQGHTLFPPKTPNQKILGLGPLMAADVVQDLAEVRSVSSGRHIRAKVPVTDPTVLKRFTRYPPSTPSLLVQLVQPTESCQRVFVTLLNFIQEHNEKAGP